MESVRLLPPRQETQGVCVATYGQSNNFPAFFSPQSGFTSPYHVRDPEEAAKLIGMPSYFFDIPLA